MPHYTSGSSTTLFIPNEARKRVKIIFIHSLIELSLVFKENICLRQMNNMHSLQNIQASLIYLLHEVPTSLVAYENKFSSTRLLNIRSFLKKIFACGR